MSQPLGIGDIAPESVLLAGAGSAILLQLANPAIGYGVARHSDFAANPLRRLHGTLAYIYAHSNGTREQQAKARLAVQRAHQPVKSAATSTHPAYDAGDPALQLWVAATLYDAGMRVHGRVFAALPHGDAEAVYRDYGVLGTALGMPAALWPPTIVEFRKYWDAQLASLSVDDTIRGVARELLAARNAPWWIKAIMPLVRFLTVGLLPTSVRDMYRFRWSKRQENLLGILFKAAAVAVKVLPPWIRHAPMRFYLKRLG